MRFINRRPERGERWLLALLPFILLALVYVVASSARLADNPDDRLLPSVAQMLDAIARMAFTEDARTGSVLLWSDTLASLTRMALGIAVAALAGLGLGIASGAFPMLRATLSPLMAVSR